MKKSVCEHCSMINKKKRSLDNMMEVYALMGEKIKQEKRAIGIYRSQIDLAVSNGKKRFNSEKYGLKSCTLQQGAS